jgi:flagellar protein FliS
MWQNAHDTYLESRILAADPLELVRMLYQAASEAVREARHQLASGAIAERGRSITKAGEILSELTGSLDYSRGGELSARLAELYTYMNGRLTEAHVRQSDGPLAEVLGLLATMSEAWDGVKAQTAPEAAIPVESPWAAQLQQESSATYGRQAWSL